MRLSLRAHLVLVAVGGIVIRRVRLELRGAGVDEPVGGDDAGGLALAREFRLRKLPRATAELAIGKAELLARRRRSDVRLTPNFRAAPATICLDVLQKPAVDLRQLEDLVDRHPVLERLREMKDPFRVRDRELQAQRLRIDPLLVPVAA